jgi:hypothetical protein
MKRPQPIPAADRRSRDLAGRRGEFVDAVVRNPHDVEGGFATVTRSISNDPLGNMAARNQIDAAQLAAGRRWQTDFEKAAGGLDSNFAADDPVDGGGASGDQVTDQMVDARKRIEATRPVLGAKDFHLVECIVGRGQSIDEMARSLNLTTERDILFVGRLLRRSLETLAIHYGLAQAKPAPRIPRRESEAMTDRTAVETRNGNRVVSVSGGRWQAQKRAPGGGKGRNRETHGDKAQAHFDPWENIGRPLDDKAAAIAVASR